MCFCSQLPSSERDLETSGQRRRLVQPGFETVFSSPLSVYVFIAMLTDFTPSVSHLLVCVTCCRLLSKRSFPLLVRKSVKNLLNTPLTYVSVIKIPQCRGGYWRLEHNVF
jgi:hypothetical protein